MGEAGFARECARVGVAGIAQQVGFSGVQATAADTLANILHKYIEEVGHRAHLYAELAGRIEANFNDVRLTFDELGLDLRELSHYSATLDETPFPKAMPEWPVKKKKGRAAPGLKDPEEPLPPHIPPFLPAFPSKHAYIASPAYQERLEDATEVRRLRSKRRRQVEAAVTRLADHIAIAPITTYDHADNPFLQRPTVLPSQQAAFDFGGEEGEGTFAAPSPLEPTSRHVAASYATLKTEELKEEEKEKRVLLRKKMKTQSHLDDTPDKAKKKAKWEKILALTHDAPVESLNDAGAPDRAFSPRGERSPMPPGRHARFDDDFSP
jgi:histone H3/H4